MSKRVTISDIAEKTGFSKTAVSFAFNKPERISEESREKILSAAREFGYIPDPMARNFSRGRHMNVGLLLPQKVESSLANPYTQSIIRGIAQVAQSQDYTFTIIPPKHSSIEEAVKNATVDGLITMGLNVSGTIDQIISQRQLPVVAIDGTENEDSYSVNIDEVSASKLQMKTALDMGHRKIAVISLQDDAYAATTPINAVSIVKKRKLGYEIALQTIGLSLSDIICVNSETTFEEGERCAGEILQRNPDTTCFVCMSDISALGAISAISKRGLVVGKDVSVIGFDGLEDLHMFGSRLTTIRQSAYEKGIRSAEVLFDIINGVSPKEKHIRIPFSMIEGETLGKVPHQI